MRGFVVFVLMVAGVTSVLSMSPTPIGDVGLAKSQVVVIGYWPKSKRTFRALQEGDTIKEHETHTDLVITKVLHGRVKPGRVRIIYGFGCDWSKDGTGLNSDTSTLHITDIDVSKPNIWFLVPGQSWDKRDPRKVLRVRTYECIQPPNLVDLFETLRRSDRERGIGLLLGRRDEELVSRSLSYVAGFDPWPILPLDYLRQWPKKDKPKRIIEHADRVRQVALHGPGACRKYAAALYAELVGNSSIPFLRRALKDRDGDVQVIAAANLIRRGVPPSAEAMQAVSQRLVDPYLGLELVQMMVKTRKVSYIPILISLLECKAEGGSMGDINGEHYSWPLFAAHDALRSLTSYSFPFDSKLSLKAWHEVSSMEPNRWASELEKRLGKWYRPIEVLIEPVANADGTLKRVSSEYNGLVCVTRVEVKNRSNRTVVVPSAPTSLSVWSDTSTSSGPVERIVRSGGFVRLGPGRSYVVLLKLDGGVFESSDTTKIYMSFVDRGDRYGLKPWLGSVAAKISPYPRTVKKQP